MAYLEQIKPRNMMGMVGRLQRGNDTQHILTYTVLPAFALFGAGMLVGATVALLLAPKSGRELRDDLTRRASEIGETVRNRLPGIPGIGTPNDVGDRQPA